MRLDWIGVVGSLRGGFGRWRRERTAWFVLPEEVVQDPMLDLGIVRYVLHLLKAGGLAKDPAGPSRVFWASRHGKGPDGPNPLVSEQPINSTGNGVH